MTEATDMPHNVTELLSGILLILAVAGFIIPALQIRKISSVIGYLFCGLILGPHALGLYAQDYPLITPFVITHTGLIHLLGELGVTFLLFTIGLELTFSRLWELRKWVLGMGSCQILVTALVIGAITWSFGHSVQVSILIGAAFALSSTAIIMKLLVDSHMIARPVGQVSFSVLLMQDLAIVPILVLVGAFAGQGEGALVTQLASALLTAALVVGAIVLLGRKLLRPLLRFLSPAQNAEWMFAITLLLVIGCAALTESFGLSAALGAFLAGILIAETEYRHEVAVILTPVKSLLLGMFFMSVGMETDMAVMLANPVWLPVSVIGIFLIKAFCFYPVARLFGVLPLKAAQSSVYLAQCGEFAFMVIGLALAGGVMSAADAQFFLMVSALSLLFTPMTVRLAPLAGRLATAGGEKDKAVKASSLPAHKEEIESHIIIAGFGRVGQTLAHILEGQKIPYIAIDRNAAQVSKLHAQGYPVVVGNADRSAIWNHLSVDTAKAIVITIDDFSVTEDALRYIRKRWPLLPVIVRAHDNAGMERYFDAGATAVVPEAYESSLRLVKILLEETGMEAPDAEHIIAMHRKENYTLQKPANDTHPAAWVEED